MVKPIRESVTKDMQVEAPLVREMEPMQETKFTVTLPLILIVCAIIAAGGITGYVLAGTKQTGSSIASSTNSAGLKKVVGIQDEKTFKDNAEGILQSGGIEGTGSHHLERPGGPSQTVYLTSSTVPLDDYNGKKVKVWGQTLQSEKAGWFMDVGRLELLE